MKIQFTTKNTAKKYFLNEKEFINVLINIFKCYTEKQTIQLMLFKEKVLRNGKAQKTVKSYNTGKKVILLFTVIEK